MKWIALFVSRESLLQGRPNHEDVTSMMSFPILQYCRTLLYLKILEQVI